MLETFYCNDTWDWTHEAAISRRACSWLDATAVFSRLVLFICSMAALKSCNSCSLNDCKVVWLLLPPVVFTSHVDHLAVWMHLLILLQLLLILLWPSSWHAGHAPQTSLHTPKIASVRKAEVLRVPDHKHVFWLFRAQVRMPMYMSQTVQPRNCLCWFKLYWTVGWKGDGQS